MIVFVLEKVPVSLRGELTRWLSELRAGVFVGNVSAMVRDKLWEHVCEKLKGGAATLLYSAANEQGYLMRTHGTPSRIVRDFDGLQLMVVPDKKKS